MEFHAITQSDLSTANHANSHNAADLWLEGRKAGTAICLVQLKDVDTGALPRAYLAWPLEIAAKLKATSDGRGDTILWATPPDIARAGTAGCLLDERKMTRERVEELMNGGAAANR